MQLGWIDFSKEDRQKAFDVINLLSEQGAVDELGIGVIRDAFANYFFPGTSTIQTRAKYFLIVPYMLREAVDGRYGKDANRVLRAIDSAEKDCGIRLLEADPKAEGVIGSRVLPKGWVARKPSDIYWNGIRTFGIFCDYGLSIPEYVSLAVKLKEQKSVSRLGNRNDDAEENDKDDSDAGDIGNIRFWNLPIYHDDWRDNLTIELTQEEAFYLDKQIQKSTKGSLLEYVLKNHIDLNEYDDFASLTAELSEKVSEKLAYMMKLACDFNNLVYMARVRYNVMLSEDENTYANDEWSRLLPDIRHNATVDLDAVFGELQLINPRAKSFLSGIQTAFMASDIDMADELIRKRERSLKGAARAKLSRTKDEIIDGEEEISDELADKKKQDIHAKIYLRRKYSDVDLYLGSMNASYSAINKNVEMMLWLGTKNMYLNGDKFLEDIFCGPVGDAKNPFEQVTVADDVLETESDNRNLLEQKIKDLCRVKRQAVISEDNENAGKYKIEVEFSGIESDSEVTVSPFNSKQEQTLSEHIEFLELEILQLSEFYEITARSGDDTIRRIIMIPTSGFPDDRESAAVNSVVKDRASFVEYIAFVLGDDYVASMLEGKQMGESGFFANSSDAMPALYEKMLKTSVEEPERIKDIGYVLKMVTDKDIIPDEFRELYETFCNTLKIRR